MNNASSNYPCQDMYVKNSIHSNTGNQSYHNFYHTPGLNLSRESITRCYQRKKKLKNWMEIIKNDPRRLLENSCIVLDS